MDRKKIILSGMRPTGKLHIGHYVGALENWVQLQETYQNYHLIADYHTLTTSLDTTNVYDDTIDDSCSSKGIRHSSNTRSLPFASA